MVRRGKNSMEQKITVVWDKEGNTLDVWFGKPREAICEEVGDEVIIKKDKTTGELVGFEKLNYNQEKDLRNLPVEVIVQ